MKSIGSKPPAITRRCVAWLAVSGLGLALPLHGQIVDFTFSGTLTDLVDSGTVLSDLGLMVGTPFSGTIRYDLSQVTFDGFNGTQPNAASWHFSPAQFTLNLTLAGHALTSLPTDTSHNLSVENDLALDRLSYDFNSLDLDGNVQPDSTAFVFLTDLSQSALPGKALPPVAPAFSDFPDQRLLHIDLANGSISFTGNLTRFSGVPEPASGAGCIGLLGAGAWIWSRSRRN